MIPTSVFVDEMRYHWTERLGNVSNHGLEEGWRKLAECLIALYHHNRQEGAESLFKVLPLPTGSGKTQGVILYLSLFSKFQGAPRPSGLIITRRKSDADGIAQQINDLAQQFDPLITNPIAISYHSGVKGKIDLETLREYTILVICHKAYQMALEALGDNDSAAKMFDSFCDYGDAKSRDLVIIDEAIDLVELHRADEKSLESTLHIINRIDGLSEKYQNEKGIIERIVAFFRENKNQQGAGKEKIVIKEDLFEGIDISHLNFSGLADEIKISPLDQIRDFGKTDADERLRIRTIIESQIKAVNAFMHLWLYFTKEETLHAFNTGKLLIPSSRKIRGALILDATAGSNAIYDVFDKAELVALPSQRIRSYEKVTLHVSKGHFTGKCKMKKNRAELVGDLVAFIKDRLGGKRVLVVTHKDLTSLLTKYRADDLGLDQFSVNHYGNIDGSNEWQGYDTVVLFGLPHRPTSWSASIFMAFQGVQETEWLHSRGDRPFRRYNDIRAALTTGQLVSDVVQAINRIRCRRVVDPMGNCEPADIFLMLGGNAQGGEIVRGIQREMPNIGLKDWEFSSSKRRVQGTNQQAAVMTYLQHSVQDGDKVPASELRKALGIPPRTFVRIMAEISLGSTLEHIGIHLILRGSGRTPLFYRPPKAA